MSLLERINQKNDQKVSQTAGQIAEQEAEQQKPDARQSRDASRQNYSQFMANGPRQQMQEQAPSPEEQEQFTALEKEMAELIYGESTAHRIAKAVEGAQDPVEGIADMAVDVIGVMERKHKGQIGEDVRMALGESAVEQVTEVAESASPSLDLTETQMAESMSIAITKWMEDHPGQVSGDMMQYMAQKAPSQMPPGMNPQQQAAPIQTMGGPDE